MLWLAVAVAGAVGAPARFLADRWLQARSGRDLPVGTLAVNVAGSLVLGLVAGAARHHGLGPVPQALVGTGFCGALTTFSTFGYETVALAERGAWRAAGANVAANLVVGLAAAAIGLAVASAA